MLKVECESCKAPYQIDEKRIPPQGLKMRCPRCGHAFVVRNPALAGGEGAKAEAGDTKRAAATVLGTGKGAPPPPAGGQPGAAPGPRKAPQIVKRAPGTAPGSGASPVAAPVAAKPQADLPAVFGGMEEAALPVVGGGGAKPEPARRKATIVGVGLEADLPAPTRGGGDDLDLPAALQADLPSRTADLPAAAKGGRPPAPFGERDSGLDLPVAAAGLPAAAAGLPVAAAGLPSPAAGLPSPGPGRGTVAGVGGRGPAAGAPKAGPGATPARPGKTAGFGELDLPVISAQLPTSAAALPANAAGLPSPAAGLPMNAGLPQVLEAPPTMAMPPAVPSAAAPSMPATRRDSGAFGELDLPLVGVGEAPMVTMPTAPVKEARAPAASPFGDFGELDLPTEMPETSAAGPPPAPPPGAPVGGGLSFGELDLPPPPTASPMSPPKGPPPSAFGGRPPPVSPGSFAGPPPTQGSFAGPPPPASGVGSFSGPAPQGPGSFSGAMPGPPGGGPSSGGAGGMGFGELDLGTGGGDGAGASLDDALGLMPNVTPPADSAFGEATPSRSPDTGGGYEASLAEVGARRLGQEDKPATATSSGKGGKIAAGVLAVVVVVGAALQLTRHGAFGYLSILDAVHAKDYVLAYKSSSEKARGLLVTDTYDDARAALEELGSAHKRFPRARPVTALAAFAAFDADVRYGRDDGRPGRGALWIAEIPQGEIPPGMDLAQAAQTASKGELDRAKKSLDAAIPRAGDAMVLALLLRAEVDFVGRDFPAALQSFRKALEKGPTARGFFGLARSYMALGDRDNARKAADEALKLAPRHAAAQVLLADIAFRDTRDHLAALKILNALLDEKERGHLAPFQQADAMAIRGYVHMARGAMSDARRDFDEAVKLNGRCTPGLVGQGEVLYSEGRFTEALSRFDTAVQGEPDSIKAIVGDAKTKVSLERLQDAKAQLSAAKEKFPRSMDVLYGLAGVETALGNKSVAEQLLGSAITVVDTKDPDAVLPYVGLARLLSSQGRATEAEVKLEEAQRKLPDSALLQRALGEVAADQGKFDDAVVHFHSAIEKDVKDLQSRFRLGVTLRRMRRFDDAAAELDKVAAADKDFPGLAMERGLLYEQSGDVQKALEQFQSALAKAPDDPDLQLRVGAAFVAIHKPDEAIPILKKVLDKRPTSAEAHHYLGRAFFDKGDATAADAMLKLRRAVELDANRAEYHLYVAWAANDARPAQLGLAKDEVEKALEIDKLLADGYWQRGVILAKQGSIDDALKDLRHALELKPSRIDAYAAMAEAYGQKNDVASSMASWKIAASAPNARPYWLFGYGRALLDRGNAAEAVSWLTRAVAAADEEKSRAYWVDKAYFLAGEAYRKSGKAVEAMRYYAEFVKRVPSSPDSDEARKYMLDAKLR